MIDAIVRLIVWGMIALVALTVMVAILIPFFS